MSLIKIIDDYKALYAYSNKRFSFLSFSFFAVLLIRLRLIKNVFLKPLSLFCAFILYFLYRIEVAGRCEIGGGLILPHPHDIIIGASSVGKNVMILNSVTLGAAFPDPLYIADKRPRIGNKVFIGVGARILGGVSIADNVVVGANSVVVSNVNSGKTVGGIPAVDLKNA
jgi:serine O-acetyltransferase